MMSMHPADFQAKSKEIYNKVQDDYRLKNPYMGAAGGTLNYLNQVIKMMKFHVPRDQWTTEDYVRLMRSYHDAIEICMRACKSKIEFYRHALIENQIDVNSINNIYIDLGVLDNWVRDAIDFYLAYRHQADVEFHFVAQAALLNYYRQFAKGDFSLKPASMEFKAELQDALKFMKDCELQNFFIETFTRAQLYVLANYYKYSADIYILDKQYDEALRKIMKMCDAITLLPPPAHELRPEENCKSHNEFIAMYDAYKNFKNIFPEKAYQSERYSHMKQLLDLAQATVMWHTDVTPEQVKDLFNDICKQDFHTSWLQREFLKNIIKNLLGNLNSHVLGNNNLAIALRSNAEQVNELRGIVTQLEKLETNRGYAPVMFKELNSPTHSYNTRLSQIKRAHP